MITKTTNIMDGKIDGYDGDIKFVMLSIRI